MGRRAPTPRYGQRSQRRDAQDRLRASDKEQVSASRRADWVYDARAGLVVFRADSSAHFGVSSKAAYRGSFAGMASRTRAMTALRLASAPFDGQICLSILEKI